MSRIGYIMNAGKSSGVGLSAFEVLHHLRTSQSDIQPVPFLIDGSVGNTYKNSKVIDTIRAFPGPLKAKSIQWIRLGRRLRKMLNRASGKESYGLFHFTNQTLAFLAPMLQPSVVTVHDLIELTDPQDSRSTWIHWYLTAGIPKANKIIAVSQYTQKQVSSYFSIPENQIEVIHNGVSKQFSPIINFKNTVGYQHILRNHKIDQNTYPVILFVGSDHPRKNLSTALEVFAKIRSLYPHALFIKMGLPGIPAARETTIADIEKHKLHDAVRIIDHVDQIQLQELYNAADVLLFPSTHEGFGLPALEAMACGTPVVTSNTTSLPEVVGDAGLQYDPFDIEGMVQGIQRLLEDAAYRQSMIGKGIIRAREFSWETATNKVVNVYRSLL